MKIQKANTTGVSDDHYEVVVEANELRCDKKTLPHKFTIGVIWPHTYDGRRLKKPKITLWTPSTSVPRGYKKAAMRVLDQAAHQILTREGDPFNLPGKFDNKWREPGSHPRSPRELDAEIAEYLSGIAKGTRT